MFLWSFFLVFVSHLSSNITLSPKGEFIDHKIYLNLHTQSVPLCPFSLSNGRCWALHAAQLRSRSTDDAQDHRVRSHPPSTGGQATAGVRVNGCLGSKDREIDCESSHSVFVLACLFFFVINYSKIWKWIKKHDFYYLGSCSIVGGIFKSNLPWVGFI